MNSGQRIHRVSAFTLVELLTVMAIISILAALVLSSAGYIQKKSARSRAEAEITALAAALENYKADNGDYPTNAFTSNNAALVTALMPAPGSGKVYFEFRTNALDTNGSFLDPNGDPYGYIYTTNGSTNNGAGYYDLWSGTGVKNW